MLRSVIDTIIKSGQNVLNALTFSANWELNSYVKYNMKYKILFFVIVLNYHHIAVCQIQKVTPELVIGLGVNYGLTHDFVNTNDLKLSIKKSNQFQLGVRLRNNKRTILYDCGIGLSSINPYFFIGKENFNSVNAEDIYASLPPIYEFPYLYLNLLTSKTIITNKYLNLNVLFGAGIKYLPKRGYFDWSTQEYSGNEIADFTLIFDEKFDKNTSATNSINRKIIFNYYLGINILPFVSNSRKLNLELFLNPSINTGVGAIYNLSTPRNHFIGNYNFKFSSLGLKIFIPLKKNRE